MPEKKPRKILLFTRPITPPWDEASKNLAFEIAKNSARTDLIFHLLSAKNTQLEKYLKENKLSSNHLQIEKIYTCPNLRMKLSAKMQLLKRLFQLKPQTDIIHFLFTPRNLTSFLIKFRLSFSSVKTIQTLATLEDKLYQEPKKLKAILFADKIVAQSKFTAKKLKDCGLKNVTCIYPGIDLKKFQPREKDSKILRELNLLPANFVILFAGEYTRLEAMEDLTQAMEKVLKKEKNAKLILACRIKSEKDKNKKIAIQKFFQKNGLAEQVVFLETFSPMEKLYSLSDLNIFPVRNMQGKFDLPLALVEAMAMEKPVIATAVGALEELIENEKTGIIIEPNNPEKLAEKILWLKDNPKKCEILGRQAREFVVTNFDIVKNAKKYQKLYQEI